MKSYKGVNVALVTVKILNPTLLNPTLRIKADTINIEKLNHVVLSKRAQ